MDILEGKQAYVYTKRWQLSLGDGGNMGKGH